MARIHIQCANEMRVNILFVYMCETNVSENIKTYSCRWIQLWNNVWLGRTIVITLVVWIWPSGNMKCSQSHEETKSCSAHVFPFFDATIAHVSSTNCSISSHIIICSNACTTLVGFVFLQFFKKHGPFRYEWIHVVMSCKWQLSRSVNRMRNERCEGGRSIEIKSNLNLTTFVERNGRR